jgi:hypothetical protein
MFCSLMQYAAVNSTLRLVFAFCITDDLSNPMLSIHNEMQIPSMHLPNSIPKTPQSMDEDWRQNSHYRRLQNIPVLIQNDSASAVPMIYLVIFQLVRTGPRLLLFSVKSPSNLDTLYCVMYLTSHSRTLGSAKPWYSCTMESTFQPATCRMTATAQPVRCCEMHQQWSRVLKTYGIPFRGCNE